MSDYQQRIKIMTPVGRAGYCWLDRPSTLHNADGMYQVDVHCKDEAALSALKEELEAHAEGFRGFKGLGKDVPVHLPLHPTEDQDTGELTGEWYVRTKLPAVSKLDGTTQRPIIVDADGEPEVPSPSVGNGSLLRVAGTARCSLAKGKIFVSIDVKAAQIVKLVDFREAARKKETADILGGITALEGYKQSEAKAESPTADIKVPF